MLSQESIVSMLVSDGKFKVPCIALSKALNLFLAYVLDGDFNRKIGFMSADWQ